MTRRKDGPVSLGESLASLASRYKKVDLLIIDEVRARWPAAVGEVLAERCVPELVKDASLVVRVPSGAFAERLRRDERTILEAFADLGGRAPTSLTIVVGKAQKPL